MTVKVNIHVGHDSTLIAPRDLVRPIDMKGKLAFSFKTLYPILIGAVDILFCPESAVVLFVMTLSNGQYQK